MKTVEEHLAGSVSDIADYVDEARRAAQAAAERFRSCGQGAGRNSRRQREMERAARGLCAALASRARNRSSAKPRLNDTG